jgi:NAD(P)H-nitrite reductase large subunit
VWGIIPAALEQAPVAARSILASAGLIPVEQANAYVQTVPKTALKVGGIEMMSLGKVNLSVEETDSGKYEIVLKMWDDADRYEKFVLENREGKSLLAGVILYGSKLHQARAQKMMGQPVTRAEIDAILAE